MHTISVKILAREGNAATLEISGAVAEAYGFGGPIADYLSSLGYLLNNGFRQSIGDAGAMPKGTPEADVKASRRERHEALKAGYQGNAGGSRTPLWARLAADRVRTIAPAGAKPGDVILAVIREDAKTWAKWAKARKLNADKVARAVEAAVAYGKREAARRAAEDAEGAVDLSDLS